MLLDDPLEAEFDLDVEFDDPLELLFAFDDPLELELACPPLFELDVDELDDCGCVFYNMKI